MNIKCAETDNVNVSLEYYNSLKTVSDDLLKYIKSFKNITNEYMKKLITLQSNFSSPLSKIEGIKSPQIIRLTDKIPQVLSETIMQYEFFLGDTENKIKTFENFVKEKTEEIKVLQNNFIAINNDLFKKNELINKAKVNYLNLISKAEDAVSKYFSLKKKLEDSNNGASAKLNDVEANSLKLLIKSEQTIANNIVKSAKKSENEYQNIIQNSLKYEKCFVENNVNLRNNTEKISCDLSERIKELILFFMMSLKNTYKLQIGEAENVLSFLNSVNEGEETKKIISECFEAKNKYQFNQIENYELKSFKLLNEDIPNPIQKKGNRIYEILDDGFSEMKVIVDDSVLMTIKSMYENFKLIEKDNTFDLKIEEEKNQTKQLIQKIIFNMKIYGTKENKIGSRIELKPEEIEKLITLLDKHHNRVITLQRLSDYRGLGKFFLCQKDYEILCKVFNTIADKIERDADHHSAELIIILSETYYYQDKNEKKYIQSSIVENKLFKSHQFWEDFLCFSINKEIMKTLKRDEKVKEDKKNSDYKFSNVVFGQLLTLIDNMFEFGLRTNEIKEILKPKIEYYKINDPLKQTINDVIDSKEGEIKTEEEAKKENKENNSKDEGGDKKEKTDDK